MRVEKSLEGKQRSTAGKLRGDLRLGQSPGFLSFFPGSKQNNRQGPLSDLFQLGSLLLRQYKGKGGKRVESGKGT